eukprot:5874871-Amphidinium_carterae.1
MEFWEMTQSSPKTQFLGDDPVTSQNPVTLLTLPALQVDCLVGVVVVAVSFAVARHSSFDSHVPHCCGGFYAGKPVAPGVKATLRYGRSNAANELTTTHRIHACPILIRKPQTASTKAPSPNAEIRSLFVMQCHVSRAAMQPDVATMLLKLVALCLMSQGQS